MNSPIIKYYLQIEARYQYRDLEEDSIIYRTKIVHSDLFESQSECITYANKIILSNLWMEQFPGFIGNRLSEKYPSAMFSLQNGTSIFINVLPLKILGSDDIHVELKKFNIPRITGDIK